MISQTATQN